jgi:hypothetical protein
MMQEYRQGELTAEKVKEKTIAWLNHAGNGDTWRLREKMLSEIII